MPEISTSIAPLSSVKTSLLKFNNETNDFPHNIFALTDKITSCCTNELNNTNAQVDMLNADVDSLKKKIANLESQIKANTKETQQLERELPLIQERLTIHNRQIERLRISLHELQSYLARANTPEEKNVIQEQISQVFRQLNEFEGKAEDLSLKISNTYQRIQELNQKITEMKNEKLTNENELTNKVRRLGKLKDKYEQMKSIFATLKVDCESLVVYSKAFGAKSSEVATNSIGKIDKCITYIDEYLNTNL